MAKRMKVMTAVVSCCTILFTVYYILTELGWILTAAITFGTFSYHLLMRLAVGWIMNGIMHNQADLNHPWFRLHSFEKRLYRILKIKKWKNKMPTYSPELFDPAKHAYLQIAQAMCQAEIVHECIIVLSFLPLFASLIFGEFWAFLITSILAAIFDSFFVMIQRFNRPRVLKLAEYQLHRLSSNIQQEQVP